MSGSANFNVSARLQLTGNAEQVLRSLGRALTSLNARIAGTERNAQKLATTLGSLGNATAGLTRLTGAFATLRTATQGVSSATQGVTRAMNSQTAAMNRNLATMQRIGAAAQQATQAMRALAAVPPPPALPNPPRQGRGGGGRGRRAEEPTLLERAGSVREGVSRARFAAAPVMGMLAAGGGEQQAETMLRAQAVPDADRARIMGSARDMVRQVPGTSITDAVGAVMEAQGAIGREDTEGAIGLAPHLLRAARLSATASGRTTREGLRPIARSLAIRGSFTGADGRLNIEQGAREIRELENSIIGFNTGQGEGVDPREIEGFFKQSGTAGRRMSIEGVAGPMMSLIQEVGGQRAGTMATAFNDQIVSGVMSRERRAAMHRGGLLVAPGRERQAEAEDEARLQRLQSEGKLTAAEAEQARAANLSRPQGDRVRGRGLAVVRNDLWMQEVFAERARATGRVTEDQQLDWWDEIGSRATGRRFGMSMLQTREVRADIGNVERIRAMRAGGQDPTGIVLNEGYANSLANMTAGLTNLITALGNAPAVVGLMNDMARGLNDLAEWVRANPSLMQEVVVQLRQFVTDLRTVVTAIGSLVGGLAPIIRAARIANNPLEALGLLGPRREATPDSPNPGRQVPEELRSRVPDGLREGAQGLGRGARNFGQRFDDGVNGMIDRARRWFRGSPTPGPGADAGDPAAPGPRRVAFNPLPPAGETVVRVPIYLDGRVLAEGVSRHQGAAMAGPVQAAPRYDVRRGLNRPEVRGA